LVAAEQLIVQIQHAIGKAGDTLVSRQEGIVRQLTATVERRPHDEGLQQSYIAALLLQAKMYFEQSRFAESQSIVEAALARSRAPGRHGPQREFQRLERAALTALSVYHLQQGHAAAARESMQELLRLAESMAAECPPLHPDAVALCQTFALQSLVLQQNQAWDEAQVAIGRAIDLHRRWLDADPSNVAARQSMAALHLDAQRLACGRGQLETARRHCLDALEILSPLAGSEVKSHVALLAQLNSQLGDLESAQGHYAEAEAAHQRQLLYGQRLYALDPNSPLPLAGLLSCWQKLATCAENLGNHAEHQRRWTEFDKLAAELAATELSSTGQFTLAQTAVERGKSMARCGNWRQALSMAPHVIAFAREQIAARAAAVVPLLNGLIQVCVLVATESGPESVELPHEARAYCQACIAIVEGAPDQMPDGEQELLRQAVQAWRVQLTRIDTALVSAFR